MTERITPEDDDVLIEQIRRRDFEIDQLHEFGRNLKRDYDAVASQLAAQSAELRAMTERAERAEAAIRNMPHGTGRHAAIYCMWCACVSWRLISDCTSENCIWTALQDSKEKK